MHVKRAICYAMRDSGRSRTVALAMSEGLQRHGWQASVQVGFHGVTADLAIGYGWLQRRIFDSYKGSGASFLYVDMGYWNRKPKGAPRDGHHKVVLNGWCPSKTMRHGMPRDRFSKLNIPTHSQPRGANIVLAGMSAKSALDHGYAIEQWDRDALLALHKISNRQIVYRPKPSWEGAKPIPGATFDDIQRPIEATLASAHALVTRHSNTAIDALCAGVPYYCEAGAAVSLAMPAIREIETAEPAPLEARLGLLADIAYLQWTPAEMRAGLCWDYYKGLLL